MSRPKYIMNEKKYVEINILTNESYILNKDFAKDLYLVIKYAYYYKENYIEFIKEFIESKKLEYIKWEDYINDTIKSIEKNNIKLKEFDSIPITESDWSYISSLSTPLEKKVLFTLIVLSKFIKIDNPSEANIAYSFSEIHKLANMNNIKKIGKIETESSLCDLGLVNIKIVRDKNSKGGKTIYNVPCSVNEGKVLFEVICKDNNLESLGRQYNDMKKVMDGANVKRCKMCGKVIKNVSGNLKYCKDCSDKMKKEKYIKYNKKRNSTTS